MKKFQTILLIIFAVGLVIGIIVFSQSGKSSSGKNKITVTLWGTIPERNINSLMSAFNEIGRAHV